MDTAANRKAALERDGWRVASITGGQHLKRVLEMYDELGVEVLLEEIDPQECADCTECYKADNESMYRVYTKPNDQSDKCA